MGGYSRRSARRKHVICNGHFRSTPGGWLYTHAPGDGRRVSSVRTVRVSFAGKNSIDHPPSVVAVTHTCCQDATFAHCTVVGSTYLYLVTIVDQ